MLVATNAYRIPVVRVRGHCCRTNLPSNTAMRSAGVVQPLLICESMVQRVADELRDMMAAESNHRDGDRNVAVKSSPSDGDPAGDVDALKDQLQASLRERILLLIGILIIHSSLYCAQ